MFNNERPKYPTTFPGSQFPPLHTAVDRGDLKKVVDLVAQDPNVVHLTTEDDRREQPLHLAAWQGRAKIAKFLLEHGADVHAPAYLNWTPLHYAAKYPRRNVATTLLDAGGDPNAPDLTGRTPLHLAILECDRDCDVVRDLLLRRGARVDIYAAACLGMGECVADLVGADPEIVQKSPLRQDLMHDACLMISYRASLNRDKQYIDVFYECEGMLRLLTKHGAPIGTALGLVVPCDTPDGHVTSFFLSLGADANAPADDGQSPIRIALYRNQSEVVRLLRDHGAHE
ncbi:MAG: ankyrin repeat domain-containing protein [Planctomycetia bacterium]|nr:ankyrin repeat domain-containing protein [Planctomycetia bacterium]